jgi:hypothetical protein
MTNEIINKKYRVLKLDNFFWYGWKPVQKTDKTLSIIKNKI